MATGQFVFSILSLCFSVCVNILYFTLTLLIYETVKHSSILFMSASVLLMHGPWHVTACYIGMHNLCASNQHKRVLVTLNCCCCKLYYNLLNYLLMNRPVLDLRTPDSEGWKAEWTYVTGYIHTCYSKRVCTSE